MTLLFTLTNQTAEVHLTHEGGGVVRYIIDEFSADEITRSTRYEGITYNPDSLTEVLTRHLDSEDMMDLHSILRSQDDQKEL